MKKTLISRLLWRVVLVWLVAGWAGQATGQAPAWQWAASSNFRSLPPRMAADQNGNLYFTGAVGPDTVTARFGPLVFPLPNVQRAFLAKMTPDGHQGWVFTQDKAYFFDIDIDRQGNTYVLGRFRQTVRFGATTLTAVDTTAGDLFVAKLSAAGAWRWAVNAGSPRMQPSTWQHRIRADERGGICLMVDFEADTMRVGTAVLVKNPASRADQCIAKIDSSGVWQWAVNTGDRSAKYAFGLAADATGNVYLTGTFAGDSATFGPVTLRANSANPSQNADLYVAKLSPAGQWQWAVGAGGTGYDVGVALATDARGDVYLTGFFTSPATFGPTTLSTGTPNTTGVMVAKISPTGVWQWAQGSTGNQAYGMDLRLDALGNVIVTGGFKSRTLQLGATSLTNASLANGGLSDDIFLTKLSGAGVWQWATSVGGDYEEYGGSVALDGQGNIFLAGPLNSPRVGFGATAVTADHISDGNPSLYLPFYVARLGNASVGLSEGVVGAAFNVAPNPAHHTVRLTGAPVGPVEIIDALGRVVRTETVLPGVAVAELSVAGLAPGLYGVRAGTATRRLVVE